jgi:hypothetical protein
MKRSGIFALLIFAAFAVPAYSQTYNSNSGGWNTGYGTVYGSFGYAMATQNIYNTTQMQIQRLTMRQAMINKWGLAAVEKAEREAKTGSTSSQRASSSVSGPVVPPPAPPPKYYGKFRPDASAQMIAKISDSLGDSAEEKALLKQVIDGVKAAFEKETSAKGWKNNIAGAVTFFLITTSTIYHDAEEPSPEVSKAIYDAVTIAVDEVPEFATATNKDKQATYDLLIGFAAIPLATYAEGKQNGSAETVEVARKLSGELIRLVLKTEPDKVRFDSGSMTIEK